MESIEKAGKIDKSKLGGEYYFKTLMEQALTAGLLSETDCGRIQAECVSLLAKQAEKYSGGDSSVMVETAQKLLSSILYTIGIQLKEYPSPDDAAAALASENAEDIYIAGLKRIGELTRKAKALHALLAGSLISTLNIFYRSAAVDAVNGFFKLYNPEYGSHLTHITADYPTCNGVNGLTGIEFIYKYTQNLYFENLFCSRFTPLKIHRLLCGIDVNYKDIILNIYEPVLLSSLGCVIVGKNPLELSLTDTDIDTLSALLKVKEAAKISDILTTALKILSDTLSLPAEVCAYATASIVITAPRVKLAVTSCNAGSVFIKPKLPESRPVVSFSFGEKMNDEAYREMIEEITSCRYTRDKIDVIKERIRSLADFEDTLCDAGLSDDEIAEALKLLSSAELAALLKKHQSETEYTTRDGEMQLTRCLNSFIASLPEKTRKEIETVADSMTETDAF